MDNSKEVQNKKYLKDNESFSTVKKVSKFEKNIRPRVKAMIEQVRKKNEEVNKRGR